MNTITVVTPCYNEVRNVRKLVEKVLEITKNIANIKFHHLFIDNASTDGTIEELRTLVELYPHVQVILNNRNYGHLRSPYYGLLQAKGDAVVMMAADFQDPPELISQFILKWQEGFKAVVAVKVGSKEPYIIRSIRNLYYRMINKLSDTPLIKNYYGFGLYDRDVITVLKSLNDPYPYFRGLISEFGFKTTKINFVKPIRDRDISKNNFFTLYDIALLGITNYSKIPLRIATISGFILSFISCIIGLIYFVFKIIYWDKFELGLAPLILGIYFFASLQLFFLGIIGEYIGSILTQVLRRPLVIEQERINF